MRAIILRDEMRQNPLCVAKILICGREILAFEVWWRNLINDYAEISCAFHAHSHNRADFGGHFALIDERCDISRQNGDAVESQLVSNFMTKSVILSCNSA